MFNLNATYKKHIILFLSDLANILPYTLTILCHFRKNALMSVISCLTSLNIVLRSTPKFYKTLDPIDYIISLHAGLCVYIGNVY